MARACPHSWFRPRTSVSANTENTLSAQQEQSSPEPENDQATLKKTHNSDQNMQTDPPAQTETSDSPPTNANESAQMENNAHNDNPPASADDSEERLLDSQGLIIMTPPEEGPRIPNPPVPPSQSTDSQPSFTEPSPPNPRTNQASTAQSEMGDASTATPTRIPIATRRRPAPTPLPF